MRAADRGADGRFEKRTSAHFVLYQDVDIDEWSGLRGSRRFERQVLEELERAHDLLDELLGLRAPRPLDVVVYDPGLFDAEFAGLFRFAAAGFYHGVIRVRGATQLDVPLARVLHHELVHATFDAVMPSTVLPAWLNEGIAEWFEARGIGKRHLAGWELEVLARARAAGALLPLAALAAPSFAGFGPEEAQLAYLESYGFVEHLERRHGERSLRELCDGLVRTRDLARTLRRIFRGDLATLEAGFFASLE